jgi:hypothetical protein
MACEDGRTLFPVGEFHLVSNELKDIGAGSIGKLDFYEK